MTPVLGGALPLLAALAPWITVCLLGVLALRGWNAWLASAAAARPPSPPLPNPAGARIEVADLKERIRRLEAIAAGVEL